MLRCSNVGALQTAAGRGTALRLIQSSYAGYFRARVIGLQSPISSGAVAQRIPGRGNLGPSPFCVRAVGGSRTYATDADAAENIPGEENDDAPVTRTPTDEKTEKSRGAPRKRDSLLLELAKEGTSPKAREERKQEQRGWSNFSLEEIRRAEAAANREVIWLTDRATLAERVEKVLQKRDALFAATLVRKAQRLGLGSTAAWNYLMEYCMKQNEPQAAWRFYNEVGCFPFGRVWLG